MTIGPWLSHAGPRVLWAIFLIIPGCFLWPQCARADEISDFNRARAAYEAQEYGLAAKRFESLVGGRIAKIRSRPLLLESRKYLAVTYLFLGRRADAESQFRQLLQVDPNYMLDPVSFPRTAVDLFASVKGDVRRAQRSQQLREREAKEARQREVRALQHQRNARRRYLFRLAQTETVEKQNSRWVAMLPFGIGQFQNGDRRLGLALAVGQTALAIASVTTFFLHAVLEDDQPSDANLEDARQAERALRLTNWITTGVLAGVAVAGVVDAQLRFVPVETQTRRREIPRRLSAGLGGPGTLAVVLRAKF